MRGKRPRTGAPGRVWAWRPGREALIALGVPLLAVAAILVLTNLRTEGTAAYRDPGWDRHLYIEMARTNPFDFHLAPFCWRVLVPAVAKASPLPLQATFLAVAVIAVAATGGALYRLWRRDGLPPPLALAGVLFVFSLGWGARFQLADFWIPDAAAFCAVALALLFARTRQPLAFALVLAAGVAGKESVLLVAPLYFTLNFRAAGGGRRLALETLGVAVPAAALLAALRLAIPATNTDPAYLETLPPSISRFPELFPDYNYLSLLRNVGYEQRYHDRSLDTFLRYTTGSFGLPLMALAAVALRRHRWFALRLAPFVVLAFAQLLFATDTERLLVLAAPAVAWLALLGAQDLVEWAGVRPWQIAVLAAGSFALLLADRDSFDVPLRAQALLLAAWAGGVAVLRATAQRRAGAASTSPPR